MSPTAGQIEIPLVRTSDPPSSHAAAEVIARSLNGLHRQILGAFADRPGMSARQAERLDEFASLGPSTVRKRVSELAQLGYLTAHGTENDSGRVPCIVYRRSPKTVED